MSAPAGFASRMDDGSQQLVDATWAPSPYVDARLDVAATLGAAARVRAWVRGLPLAAGLGIARRDELLLLLSEVVTNAARHAGGADDPIAVHVAVAEDRIRFEVCDGGGGLGHQRAEWPPALAEGGRGLLVVDAVASAWGTAHGDRHCVWVELER